MVPSYFPQLTHKPNTSHFTDPLNRLWAFKKSETEKNHVIVYNGFGPKMINERGFQDLGIDFLVIICVKERTVKIVERDLINELKIWNNTNYTLRGVTPGVYSLELTF
jgi:hypothetical protein